METMSSKIGGECERECTGAHFLATPATTTTVCTTAAAAKARAATCHPEMQPNCKDFSLFINVVSRIGYRDAHHRQSRTAI